MLYDRVMKSIRNRHKRIKHMNSVINARLQRKLRKFAENPLSGSRVSGPTFRASGLGSWVPPVSWVPGLGSRVPPLEFRVSGTTKSPGSPVQLFGYPVFSMHMYTRVHFEQLHNYIQNKNKMYAQKQSLDIKFLGIPKETMEYIRRN